ncbi:hypothetical protein PXH66_16290 [Synoicihabitans lomoniglobus]|uniref:Uncharacterized protein n=2 Tax=Synoicihabitans lomoniglobus TaxID=2909285 RepID=A0AAE9ZTN2_9BACT|nr:hypothetical protein PXH66_16290 [Opitutaceae bacterium LMO-M01]
MLLAVGGLALTASPGGAQADERNWWPLWVSRTDPSTGDERTSFLGPLGFEQTAADATTIHGLRPFFDEAHSADGSLTATSAFYPLWHRESDATTADQRWSFFNLINFEHDASSDVTRFDAWPFYFSRDTGSPEDSYQAVMPLYGDVPQRFGQDRFLWALFPLFGRFEKQGVTTTTTPWPFIKTVTGEGHRGFEVWPLAGHREETGVSSDSFALWPLYYRKQAGLDTDAPSLQTGLLPLYALDRSDGYISETYLWPFFGYVDRTLPYQYHATHYLWPFWVQGQGEDRRVNRWAPFYSHSRMRGYEKTWLLWPLWRQANWNDHQLHHERRQLLYFIYHADTQRSLTQPDAAPASKVHLWPLFSSWDNGAGRKQVQALSPVEVFFPHNERVRRLWSPLFALYRFNQTAPGEVRHALLWDAVTYARSEERDRREFHLGPLFGYTSEPGELNLEFLGGLIRFNRSTPERTWQAHVGPRPTSEAAAPLSSR